MGKEGKNNKERLDKYYHLAKQYGYRARSAFKLIQMNKRYDFLGSAHVLIDLCAAPGGWCQVAQKEMPVDQRIFGVDLEAILPIPKVKTYVGDITTPMCFAEMKKLMKGSQADVVLHDGSPNMGKSWIQDAYTQSELCIAALKFAVNFLRKGGWFISKVFRSQDYYSILYVFEKFFKTVTATKPPASRNTSAEVYLVCKDFLAPSKFDPNLLDPKFVFSKEEETVIPDLFSSKRSKPQGYDTSKSLIYNEGNAKDFLKCEEPKNWLATHTKMVFDEGLPVNEKVIAYGEDIKMLGVAELKVLLKWREFVLRKIKIAQNDAEQKKKSEEKKKETTRVLTEEEELELELKREEEEKDEEELLRIKKNEKQKKKEEKQKRKDKRAEEAGVDFAPKFGVDASADLFTINDIKNDEDMQLFLEYDGAKIQEELDEEANKEEEEYKKAENERLGKMTYDERLAERFDNEYDDYLESRGLTKIKAKVGKMEKEKEVRETLGDEDELRQAKQDPTQEKIEHVEEVRNERGKYEREMSKGGEEKWWGSSGMEEISGQMAILEQVLRGDVEKKADTQNSVEGSEEHSEDLEQTKKENEEEVSSSDDVEEEWGPEMGKAKLTHALSLAGRIVQDPKQRKRMLEASLMNKYATPDDEDTPIWFKMEEEKHSKVLLPETKEEIAAMRARFKEIDSRPVRKELEAQARKRKKLSSKMRELEQQATKIEGDGEINSREQLRSLQKKAQKLTKTFSTKNGVTFVNSASGKKIGGSRGRVKLVDKRMKKEFRAKKRIEKKPRKGKK
ncbi:AdoMet-dependent rRNA methyltransferase spb1, putative [Entamoeba invadens IP1]|uniref:AdoMet-dependent rRNA methyltransferase spb1, putative n=1 Tax=Entamoeba invadens IP1 TaxID=370355 RepID=A0A0A1TYD0_ENTIV|nr:AdoMet-dependent rRNA methyltransferase spb1, putative [Entamoeba invadens IP1]ELP83501.1 AdoMet-dependent rRNA methyltransferase spb1, putative [Entamoeba invadens IP1]|eukprot:XP_004182847.1 AdoMet-dependent rRNA methyltransferase spb1, putative [Entamoeba invadens IP1]